MYTNLSDSNHTAHSLLMNFLMKNISSPLICNEFTNGNSELSYMYAVIIFSIIIFLTTMIVNHRNHLKLKKILRAPNEELTNILRAPNEDIDIQREQII